MRRVSAALVLCAVAAALGLAQVSIFRQQTATATAASGTISISSVSGLEQELALRPIKGAAYIASRTAVINANGEIESALGSAGDCVKVDGTSGPCGSGVAAVFVDEETPTGSVDGVNATFTLSSMPSPAISLKLFRNGIRMKAGADFTLSGSTVTFVTGAIPQAGDLLLADYRR